METPDAGGDGLDRRSTLEVFAVEPSDGSLFRGDWGEDGVASPAEALKYQHYPTSQLHKSSLIDVESLFFLLIIVILLLFRLLPLFLPDIPLRRPRAVLISRLGVLLVFLIPLRATLCSIPVGTRMVFFDNDERLLFFPLVPP